MEVFVTEGLFAVLRAVSAHPKNPLQEKLNRTPAESVELGFPREKITHSPEVAQGIQSDTYKLIAV